MPALTRKAKAVPTSCCPDTLKTQHRRVLSGVYIGLLRRQLLDRTGKSKASHARTFAIYHRVMSFALMRESTAILTCQIEAVMTAPRLNESGSTVEGASDAISAVRAGGRRPFLVTVRVAPESNRLLMTEFPPGSYEQELPLTFSSVVLSALPPPVLDPLTCTVLLASSVRRASFCTVAALPAAPRAAAQGLDLTAARKSVTPASLPTSAHLSSVFQTPSGGGLSYDVVGYPCAELTGACFLHTAALHCTLLLHLFFLNISFRMRRCCTPVA